MGRPISPHNRQMLYKFRSKACGDVIMLQGHGDALLRLLGRQPAASGIFEVAHMPVLLATIEAAVRQAESAAEAQDPAAAANDRADAAVGLRQRLWPIADMLHRSQAADEPVVWGV